MDKRKLFSKLPSVDEVLGDSKIVNIISEYPRDLVIEGIREAIDINRKSIINLKENIHDFDISIDDIVNDAICRVRLKYELSLKKVINATGVVIHTNLGRSLLSESIKNEVLNTAFRYSNLEYDIDKGERGSRYSHLTETIKRIKTKGYDTGKVHLQSSYGVINYTGLDYDYVRVGILMYGINSSYKSYQLTHLNLKPVLSLKARITSVKEIDKNNSVSYGRTYIATENRKIASVSIGYADGIPRNLSNKNMQVKINESYGTVIGRICMDQLLIDISDISNVKVGDIITIIGEDDNITAEQVADKADTITNELLCRLGDRLARIIV